MRPWARDDTKEWIIQLEHRIEDIEYYLNLTREWCDEYGIDDSRVVFVCCFVTCIWVSHMREEPISFIELMEILGIESWTADEDQIYELEYNWRKLDHYDLLEKVVQRFNDEY